jgi:hypothetical protein
MRDKMRRSAVLCEQQPRDSYGRISMEWPRMKGLKTTPQEVKRKTGIAAILMAASAFLAGCSGFWDAPVSGGGGTTPTTLSSGYFYVLNQTANEIGAYYISSGTLEQLSASPYSLPSGMTPSCMAISPGGGFLYVGTDTVGTNTGVYGYSISSTGTLSKLDGGAAISVDAPFGIQVGQDSNGGLWLIEAFMNSGDTDLQLKAIPLNSSGTASGASFQQVAFSVSTETTIKQMVLSPESDYLFLALGSGGAIAVPFSPDVTTPLGTTAVTLIAPNSQQGVLSVAVDPQERLFYLGQINVFSTGTTGGLLAFSYSSLSTGKPAQINGSPFVSGGTSPNAILPEASGDYVYVANGGEGSAAGNVEWFTVSASGATYSIVAGSSVGSGVSPIGLAEDSDDHFVIAVSENGGTGLDAYTMSSGALTSAVTYSSGASSEGAVAVVALPAQ